MRILMVPPRYGAGLVGGAENHLAALGHHAQRMGMDVDIATTCATDNETWASVLRAGESTEDGLTVFRFAVSPRDTRRHAELQHRLTRWEALTPLDEADLFATSVWSKDLQCFIDDEGPGYDCIIFAPYLLGTTYWGAQSLPERTIVMPCLHDEPYAYLPSMQRVLRRARRLMFNAPGEERLVRRLLGPVEGSIVGMGFDAPTAAPHADFAPGQALGPYVIYVGRLEQGKRVGKAAEAVASFAERTGIPLTLVCVGRGSWWPPLDVAPHVHMAGFLSNDEKRAAIRGAVALVNPSELESLSIVLMEGWLEETPAIVAAGSEVMADHCVASGGGFTFADQTGFDHAVLRLMQDRDLRADMGAAGRAYVMREYSWRAVGERFESAVTSAAGGPAPQH